jgi:flagellar operon protein
VTPPIQHNPALIPPGIGPTHPIQAPGAAPASAKTAAPTGPSFADVLAQRTAGVQFSGHALARLQRRGIDVSPQTLQRLDGGVDRAAAKGSRSSVVFVDNTAFVVSVPNKTVITAVDRDHMRDHVFTNVDSAVIA